MDWRKKDKAQEWVVIETKKGGIQVNRFGSFTEAFDFQLYNLGYLMTSSYYENQWLMEELK